MLLTQITKSRKGLAVSITKEEGQLFARIGVYTICKIFSLAGQQISFSLFNQVPDFYLLLVGLSPFLTEANLFDNASRLVRFVAAYSYYTWADKCRKSLPHVSSLFNVFSFESPIINRKLAKFAVREWKIVTDDWLASFYLLDLEVFGKDYVFCSTRYGNLVTYDNARLFLLYNQGFLLTHNHV